MHRALGIGVLVVVASLGAFLAVTPPARAADVYFDLYGSTAGGWGSTSGGESTPGPTFATQSGDQIHLNLTSDDGAPHTFHLDLDGNNNTDPAEPLSPSFTTTTTYAFSAPPGTYWYKCSIHGWSMRGVWIVSTPATDTTPPSILSASVTPGSPVVNDTVTITASVTDNVGVASVTANVTLPDASHLNLTMTPGAGTTYNVSRAFANAGTYTVKIWARDAAGNNASADLTFTVSSSPPPTGGTPPADNTALWAGVSALVILVFLALALLMWRRGAKRAGPPKEEPPAT